MPEESPERLDPRLHFEQVLLNNLRQHAGRLTELLARVNAKDVYEDMVYRFYHQSFKVFHLQEYTQEIVEVFAAIAPDGHAFCDFFAEIVRAGTGKTFDLDDNNHWVERTAPIVQAFFHARYFLEMAVMYATKLTEPPQVLPSGWAALLCLYNIR
jgi:hypothetical protein